MNQIVTNLSELEWEALGKTLVTMLPVEEIQRFINEFAPLIIDQNQNEPDNH